MYGSHQLGRAALATSPAALAYLAGETGLVTLALIILLAGWLVWRSPVFDENGAGPR
jgi:hypothetical protein